MIKVLNICVRITCITKISKQKTMKEKYKTEKDVTILEDLENAIRTLVYCCKSFYILLVQCSDYNVLIL